MTINQPELFKNLKIIELASVLAGPVTGTFFSELGAEVIKVENPVTGGDVTRNWKLSEENDTGDISAYYASANYNKDVRFYNLKKDEDRQKLYDEVKTADVVISNYKKGDAKKLKVDYETLKGLNGSLIYSHLTGFGSDSKRAAYDSVVQAESGFMSMNGTPESGPLKMPVAMIDLLAAHQLKEGILCGVLKRERDGTGSLISVSLYDAAVSSLANQATNYLMEDHIARRIGSRHPNIAPYGETFKTADGKVLLIAIGNDGQFKKFCKLLDLAHIANDERFETNTDRVKNRKELDEYLEEQVRAFDSSKFERWIEDYNLPLGFVKNMKEVMEQDRTKRLILDETIEGSETRRIRNAVFEMEM